MFKFGIFDVENTNTLANNVTNENQAEICKELADNSTILLKNEDNILPISNSVKKIAVIGK